MSLKQRIKALLLGAGLELRRHNPAYVPDMQLANVLRRQRIDTLFDVGANIGQYGAQLRQLGYGGSIVSFEPLSAAHAALTAAAAGDARWQVAPRGALGASDGEIQINVAGNSVSSSVLPMLGSHADAAPDSRYTGQEAVPINRLDTIAGQWLQPQSRLFLKVDTQGFEGAVLDGAAQTLARTWGVQLELSLTPLYQDQLLAEAIIARLRSAGFAPWTLWPGFADAASGRLLQIDAIFVREAGT
ncbi:MAG: FkbM family methyltransferase [Polymorphobacter sp.]